MEIKTYIKNLKIKPAVKRKVEKVISEKSISRKIILTGVVVLTTTQLLTGCSGIFRLGKSDQQNELMLGCQVKSVTDNIGTYIDVCDNSKSIFYNDGQAIYMIDKDFTNISEAKQIVSNVGFDPKFMCATDNQLIYAKSNYALYVVNLTDFSTKEYFKEGKFDYGFSRNNEAFVKLYHTDDIYKIEVDKEPELVSIDVTEYGFARDLNDGINFRIGDMQFSTNGGWYGINGELGTEWKEVLKIRKPLAINKSTIVADDEGAYLLYQYGEKYQAAAVNPGYGYMGRTALFHFDKEDETTELIYANKKGEQIGAYSVEDKKVYVLRNDGIYAIDFEGKQEKKVYNIKVDTENWAEENNFSNGTFKRGTEIVFEGCAGKIFVYYEEDHSPRLLTVLQ